MFEIAQFLIIQYNNSATDCKLEASSTSCPMPNTNYCRHSHDSLQRHENVSAELEQFFRRAAEKMDTILNLNLQSKIFAIYLHFC